MTDPAPPPSSEVSSFRGEWILRIFAGAIGVWLASIFAEKVTEDLGKDRWRAIAFVLLGVLTTLYWIGLAVLNTPQFKAYRRRFFTPIEARPASKTGLILGTLLFSASFAAAFLVPDSYQGLALLSVVAVCFSVIA